MLVLILLSFSTANAYLVLLLAFGLCEGMSLYEVLNGGLHREIRRRRVERSSVLLCSTDEYFDSNVESCSHCSDICRPNIPDVTLCVNECRDYFLRHFNSSWRLTPSQLVTASSVALHSPGGVRDEEENLVNKPLFWTSIVSMTIATLATVAIIVLCVKRRKLLRSAVVSRSWTGSRGTETSKDQWPKSLNRTERKPDESSGKTIESGHTSGFRSRQEEPAKRRSREGWSFTESMPTTNIGTVDENYNAREQCKPKRTDHPTPSQIHKGQNKGPTLTTIASPSESELSNVKNAQTMDAEPTVFQAQKAKQLSSSSSSSVTSVSKSRESCKDAAESEIKRVKHDDEDETNLKRCTVEKPNIHEYNRGPIRQPEDIGIKTAKNNSITSSPDEILRMKINIRDIREEVNEEEGLTSNYGIFSLTEDELQSASLMR